MATQAQFTSLGQAIDADITALSVHQAAQDVLIADLQAQVQSGSGQMSGAQEDAVLATFQALADRLHALLP